MPRPIQRSLQPRISRPASRGARTGAGAGRRNVVLGALGAAVLLSAAAPAAGAPSLRSSLPIVQIDAAGPIVDDPKVGAGMRITHRPGAGPNRAGARANVYDGRIGIEIRGQSSQRFPKKQFGFETVTRDGDNRNVPLLGLPEENDWVLYAAYNDGTLMRNAIAYRAARRMGRYASRTRFVELILNGRYWGVYVLMEKLKLDDRRVPEPRDGSDGFLVEWTHNSKIDPGDTFFRSPVTRTPFIYDDPERGDVSKARAGAIARSVARAERALYGRGFRHPVTGWRAHLDEAAMVDYVIHQEWFRNHDAMGASVFLHEGDDGRLVMGPVWDLDLSADNPPGLFSPRGWHLDDRRWTSRLYRDRPFRAAVRARWAGLRRAGLIRNLRADANRWMRSLGSPQVRNLRTWPVLGQRPVDPRSSEAVLRREFRAEVARMNAWLRARAAWMTANMDTLGR